MKGPDKEFTNGLEVLEYAKDEQLFPALLSQLRKDFNRANLDFTFESSSANLNQSLRELKPFLEEKMYQLLLEDFDGYLNLMYAADIPEHSFKEINGTDVVDASRQIAFLLLRREVIKIWLKRHYNS